MINKVDIMTYYAIGMVLFVVLYMFLPAFIETIKNKFRKTKQLGDKNENKDNI